MTYLTEFTINDANRGAQFLMASPRRIKAAVMTGLLDYQAEDGRFLWHLEQSTGRTHQLSILSAQKPELRHLAEQAGWGGDDTWKTRELVSTPVGASVPFRIRVNASTAETRTGRRYDVNDPTLLKAWFENRRDQFGFTATDDFHATYEGQVAFPRREMTVTFGTSLVTGKLRVEDAEKFHQTVTNGIGRNRGYGCGLLLLGPHT